MYVHPWRQGSSCWVQKMKLEIKPKSEDDSILSKFLSKSVMWILFVVFFKITGYSIRTKNN